MQGWKSDSRVHLAVVVAAGALFAISLAAGLSYALTGGLGGPFLVFVVPILGFAYLAFGLERKQQAEQAVRLERMTRVHTSTIEALALAIDAKDPHTRGRARRVQAYALELARRLRLPEEEYEALRAAAMLHDIGKLAIPDFLLHKPGRLSKTEYQKIKVHPAVATEILANVGFPYPVLPAVRHHHERWDGSGYPDGLKGDRIPVGARVLAVADVFEALLSERPYRHRRSPEEACALIEAWSEIHFDPDIVRALRAHLDAMVEVGETAAHGAAGGTAGNAGAATPDPGGFGDALHLGARAKSPRAGRRRRDRAAAPPVTDGGAPGGEDQGQVWLERDSDGSILGRRAAALSDISSAHREVYTLYEIAQTLGASLRLAEVLELVVHKMGQVIPYTTCVFYLMEGSRESLAARFAVGVDAEALKGRTVHLGEGITGWAAAHKTSRFSDQPELDLQGSDVDPAMFSTVAAFPLVHEAEVLGVISLFFPVGVPCADDHIRMMEIIARLTASAVRNSTVFAQTGEAALTDELTSLPNSRYLRQVFEQEKVRSQHAGQPMAMLEMDLDEFKSVNDRHGHQVGDRYLAEVSRVLRAHLRERDVLVRMSGDEFAAVLPLTGFAPAAVLAERLQAAVGSFALRLDGGVTIRGGLSVGIALYPHDAETFEDVLMKADLNMYQNKAVRRNQRQASPVNLVPFPAKKPRRSKA